MDIDILVDLKVSRDPPWSNVSQKSSQDEYNDETAVNVESSPVASSW